MIVFCSIVLGLLSLALVAQEFIPHIPWAYDAILFLVPVVFFSAAITVPYPVMLFYAFFVGFVWDARQLVVLPEVAGFETFGMPDRSAPGGLAFGYSIFLYGLLGSMMQGIRPLFRRGRWELPVLLTGVATFLLVLLEYLIIEFRSGDFTFTRYVWYQMLATALLSMMISPLLFFLLYRLAEASNYRIRFDGLARS